MRVGYLTLQVEKHPYHLAVAYQDRHCMLPRACPEHRFGDLPSTAPIDIRLRVRPGKLVRLGEPRPLLQANGHISRSHSIIRAKPLRGIIRCRAYTA